MKDPILLDIPEEIETERLWLRAPRIGDGSAVNEAIVESLEELRPWFPWVQPVPQPEDTEINLRQSRASFYQREGLRYLLWDKRTEEFIGSSGFHHIQWDVPRMEIGYWTRTSRTGQGLMKEAVIALTRLAFETLGVRRLEIRCDHDNAPSQRLAEGCGFQRETVLRDYAVGVDGALRDEWVYVILRNEFEA